MNEPGDTSFTEHLGRRARTARTTPYRDLHICVVRGAMPGAAGFFEEDMLALWQEDGITTLVFESSHEEQVRAFAKSRRMDAEFLWEGRMPYGNWEAGEPMVPTHFAGFLICPAWDVQPSAPCETRLVLDSGLAFGSGLHPATRISLSLLRTAMEHVRPHRILDLGCGTGVLAIAALLLGAETAVAVDYSLLAVNASRINSTLNGVAARMEIIHDDLFAHLSHTADLVLCNMNFPLFKNLLGNPEFMSREWILLSGVNPESLHKEISSQLTGNGRAIVQQARKGDWFGYLTSKTRDSQP